MPKGDRCVPQDSIGKWRKNNPVVFKIELKLINGRLVGKYADEYRIVDVTVENSVCVIKLI